MDEVPLSRDPKCGVCKCPWHLYLPCECGCTNPPIPGIYPE